MAGIPLEYTNRAVTDNAAVDAPALVGEAATGAVIIKGVEASLPKDKPAELAPSDVVMEAIPSTSAVNIDANQFIKKPGDDGVMTAANNNIATDHSCTGPACATCGPAVTAAPATLPEAFANYANLLMQAANPEAQPITPEEAGTIIAANGGSFKAAIKDIKNRSDADYVTLLNTSAENFAEYSPIQQASFLADAGEAKMKARNAIMNLNPDAVIAMMGSFLTAPAAESYKPHDIAITRSEKIKVKAETNTTVIAL
jgi:ferredoxin